MTLTAELASPLREHVDARLRDDVIAWLTTVRPNGQPDTVPVWYLLRDDDTVVVYSRQSKTKLRNLAANPKVSLALDDTGDGDDVTRLEGTAEYVADYPPAHELPAFVDKYGERITAMFGTPERFAEAFSAAVVITPTRLHAFA
ncbi:MAG: TIGR03667 family PPOX class F420-dependent oxidoreductase [Streptosporangiales bacterium]|nr:TIGR03667 family PPOX class F420-dependent oxidoreductase [Streptosporangiales bacterium]